MNRSQIRLEVRPMVREAEKIRQTPATCPLKPFLGSGSTALPPIPFTPRRGGFHEQQ